MARTTRLELQALEGREVPADLTYGFAIAGMPVGATRIAADPLGNTYVAGSFTGTIDVDPSATTAMNLVAKGGSDAFVAKYSSTGQLMWAKTLGGTANETVADVVIDGIGNVYVAGTFTGAADFNPDPDATAALTSANGGSAYLWKLSNTGKFFMARTVGGTSTATGLTVNPAGQILVTGQFLGSPDFDPSPTGTAKLVTTNPSGSAYAWRLDVGGGYGFAKAFNTTGSMETAAIAMDGAGNAFIAGRFTGTADLDPADATKANFAAGTNWMPFITKLSLQGNYLWGRTIRTVTAVSAAPNAITGLSLDGIGNVYAAGTFAGAMDFDPGTAAFNLVSSGSAADGFAWKLDTAGVMRYAFRFGGMNAETVSEMSADQAGNVYIAGTFTGIADFDPNPAANAVANLVSGSGAADTYVLKLGRLGLMKYTRALGGGTSTTKVSGIWADGAGNMYVAGSLVGKGDFEPSPIVTSLAGGSGSMFLSKLSPTLTAPARPINTPPINRSAGGPYEINEGESLALRASAGDMDNDPLTYSWDLNGDGTFGDATGARPVVTPAQMKSLGLGDSTATAKTIRVQIGDGVNLPVEATSTLTIQNLAPTPTLAAPNKTAEGIRPVISVTTTDPSTADVKAGFHYSYDFNDDGVWDLGDGSTYAGSVLASSLKIPALFVGDSGPLAIRVRAFDKDGASADTAKTIEITNLAPTATFAPTGPTTVGVPVTFRFSSPVDVQADAAAGFTYSFDLDNDGVYEIVGQSPKATSTFGLPGTYTVRGSISDQDGGHTEYTLTVNVTPF